MKGVPPRQKELVEIASWLRCSGCPGMGAIRVPWSRGRRPAEPGVKVFRERRKPPRESPPGEGVGKA